MSVVTDWLTTKWPKIREGFSDQDIFNGDETGLFFKLLPDKTFKFKEEKCVGGKLSKERLTVFVCANLLGTEKRKLFVIGKSQNPRCFKNIKTIPVEYRANKSAWMTSELFAEHLKIWDSELRKMGRKVLLLVDNCPAHPEVRDLKNIKLEFFPPNVTSVLQPMDQGVIRSLKCHYRKKIVLRLIEEDGEMPKVNVLDAIKFLDRAWEEVTQKTIYHAFKAGGLCQGEEEEDGDEDDLPLSEWIRTINVPHSLSISENFDEFVDADLGIATYAVETEAGIIADILHPEEEEGEDDDEERQPISVKEALKAARLLSEFFNQEEEFRKRATYIEKEVEKIFVQSIKKQQKITDFFK